MVGGAWNDGFIFTAEWKSDAVTHKRRWFHTSIIVFSFWVLGAPFPSHTCECKIEKGMFVWERSLYRNIGQSPSPSPCFLHFLLWRFFTLLGIQACKVTFLLLFTHRKNSLLTEIPPWRNKPVSTEFIKLFSHSSNVPEFIVQFNYPVLC